MGEQDATQADLTPSTEFIRHLIQERQQVTRQELITLSNRHPWTVTMALNTLEARGEIAKTQNNDDLREVVVKWLGTRTYNTPQADTSE